MARLRYNGLAVDLGGSLGTADTTITFAAALTHSGGTAVPTLAAPDYIPLALLGADGALREIVHLTAYTSGATTGTILRAQEGTTAKTHTATGQAVNGLTVADVGDSTPLTSVRMGADQNLNNGVNTILTWATEEIDELNAWSASNPTRLTAPETGTYELRATVAFENGTAGSGRALTFYKNGAGTAGQWRIYPSGLMFQDFQYDAVFKLTAGDYIEVAVYAEGAAVAKATRFDNTSGCVFTMRRV